MPTAPRTVLQVAAHFGFTRETNFGAVFEVRSVPAATDLAYTSLPLDPHTDNPYRSPVPGVQLLHCLANETSGGLSTLVDGFAAAEALRASDEAAFELLASTPVRFRYRDDSTELVASAPPHRARCARAVCKRCISVRAWISCRWGRRRRLSAYYRARRRVRSPVALAAVRDPFPAGERASC